MGIFGVEDNEGSNPYSDTIEKNYSKVADNDYEAIHNTDEHALAVQVYSNYISKSTNYDDTIVSEYSEVEDADGTTANDKEEIYSDPGHSEADIYACFEKKKFRMIKRDDVRWTTYTELGVTCYKCNALCNIIKTHSSVSTAKKMCGTQVCYLLVP